MNQNLGAQTRKVLQYKTAILSSLKILTLGLSVLMFFTALYGISQMNGFDDLGQVFTGVYMLCFSIMLAAYELIQFWPWEALDNMYRRNFGFLYGVKGKGFFVIL